MNTTSTARGLFRNGITDPKLLIDSTVGRSVLLKDILEKLQTRGDKKSGINHLFIGPRGIGKTHFLSLIEQNISSDSSLLNKYTVVRFPEESNRILSFADLLLEIINILQNIDSESAWSTLYMQLETERDDVIIIDTILPYFKKWHQENHKIILLMIENLDVVLTKQIKLIKDIHHIRSFLMDNSHIILLGTAPTYFSALSDVKHPLYDFFDIQLLEELNEEEIIRLIKAHLQWDNHQDLLDNFDELEVKIQSILSLTGGNPRLTMMFYELISQDNVMEIKIQLQQLLDRITPFYQDRIKDLSPQERALLETMALMRNKLRTPLNISKQFRQSQAKTSVLLKRVSDSGYLTNSVNPKDKRSRIYRIKERFFDIWLAMNESRDNRKQIPYLLDFFIMWYPQKKQRDAKSQQLLQKLQQANKLEQNNIIENMGYLGEVAQNPQDKVQEKGEQIVRVAKTGNKNATQKIISQALEHVDKGSKGIFMWISKTGFDNQVENDRIGFNSIHFFEKIIKYWQQQNSGELEQAARIFATLTSELKDFGLHDLHIALLEEKIANTSKKDEKAFLHNDIGGIKFRSGRYNSAQGNFQQALDIFLEIGNKAGEGATLNNIALIYRAQGDYTTALTHLTNSLAICQEIGNKVGESTTLNNISQIYCAQGDYTTALTYFTDSLAISQEIGNKAGEGTTLNNISQIFHAQGDYTTALTYLTNSLEISQEIGNKAGEGATLNNIASIYQAQGDYTTALTYFTDSLAISQEIGNKAREGTTLNNISQIYDAQGDYTTALIYLTNSLAIRQEIGDKAGEGAILNNISQIYYAQGDYTTTLTYLIDSLAIFKEIGNKAEEGKALFNIGLAYYKIDKKQQGLVYLQSAKKIAQEIDNFELNQALDDLPFDV
jgi:tetratricopeptide (TPR) repeat protein/DNA-binding MarR family transcriptional regulator